MTPGELPGSSGGTEGSELADDADTRAGYAVRSSSAFWALRSFSTVFAQAEALDATARSLRAIVSVSTAGTESRWQANGEGLGSLAAEPRSPAPKLR